MEPALDLAALVSHLRNAGLRVDTRQFLAAHEMLIAYAARGRRLVEDPLALASHLGPIFCGSPEEQRLFRDEFGAWQRALSSTAFPTTSPVPTPRKWLARTMTLVGALAAVVLFAAAVYGLFKPVRIAGEVISVAPDGTQQPAAAAQVSYRGLKVAVDEKGRFRIKTSRLRDPGELRAAMPDFVTAVQQVSASTDQPLQILLHPVEKRPPPIQSAIRVGSPQLLAEGEVLTSPEALSRVDWIRPALVAVLGAGVCFLLLSLSQLARSRLALKRLSAAGDPEFVTLQPAATSGWELSQQQVRRIVTGLRRVQHGTNVELSVSATVESTARAGGLVTPAFIARMSVPEYLVLIDRRTAEDHQARLIGGWIRQLQDQGLAVDSFYFRADPRVCEADGSAQQDQRLLELLAQHHRATLVLAGDASLFFDQFSGRMHPWAEDLRALPRRVLLTPEAPYRWGRRELELADAGLTLVPATPAGLAGLAEMHGEPRTERALHAKYARAFPQLISHDEKRWLDRNPPPEEVTVGLLEQLLGYLGPNGFAWLCACAVYGEISWALTLNLLSAIRPDRDQLAERRALGETLPALARLPWFRYSFMPDWLRRLLIARLSPAHEAAVRGRLVGILHSTLAQPEARTRYRWLAPLDLVKAAPPGSPLRDGVFVGFIAETDPDPLALQLPQSLQRLPGAQPRNAAQLFRQSWRAFVAFSPTLARSAISLVIGGVVFVAFGKVVGESSAPQERTPFDRRYVLPPDLAPEYAGDPPLVHVAASRDGTSLALSSGRDVILWDAASATARSRLAGDEEDSAISGVLFSPSGALLAAAHRDGMIVVWDVARGVQVSILRPGRNRAVFDMAFSENNQLLAVAGDGASNVFDVRRSSLIFGVLPTGEFSTSIAFNPRDDSIAAGDDAGGVNFFDSEGEYQTGVGLAGQSLAVGRITYSPDGALLAATLNGSDSSTARLLQVWAAAAPHASVASATLAVEASTVVFSPDNQLLAVGQPQRLPRLIDLRTQADVKISATSLTDSGPSPQSSTANSFISVRFSTVQAAADRTRYEVVRWPLEIDSEPAPATDTGPRAEAPTFSTLDANGDGFITRKEAAAWPILSRMFSVADSDKSTIVTSTEYASFLELNEYAMSDEYTAKLRKELDAQKAPPVRTPPKQTPPAPDSRNASPEQASPAPVTDSPAPSPEQTSPAQESPTPSPEQGQTNSGLDLEQTSFQLGVGQEAVVRNRAGAQVGAIRVEAVDAKTLPDKRMVAQEIRVRVRAMGATDPSSKQDSSARGYPEAQVSFRAPAFKPGMTESRAAGALAFSIVLTEARTAGPDAPQLFDVATVRVRVDVTEAKVPRAPTSLRVE